MSRPTDTPNAIASLVAASAAAERKLFASLSACARPAASPTRRRRSLSPASTGSIASHTAAGPAYMTESVRARAPRLHLTPAHRRNRFRPPRGAGRWRGRRPPRSVDVSTTAVTRRASVRARARATCSDAGASGRLHTTTSTRRAISSTVATNTAPVRVGGGAGDVECDDFEPRIDEVGRQDAAHVAQADDADQLVGHVPSCSARTDWSARLADSPAGPPQYAAIWNNNSSSSSGVTPARRGSSRHGS